MLFSLKLPTINRFISILMISLMMLLYLPAASVTAAHTTTVTETPSPQNSATSTSKGTLSDLLNGDFASLEQTPQPNSLTWQIGICEGNFFAETTQAASNNFQVRKGTLRAEQLYTVMILFNTEVKPSALKNGIYLQARFPAAMLKDDTDAIGTDISGTKVTNTVQYFLAKAQQNLALYYVEDSLQLLSRNTGEVSALPDQDAMDLLTSAVGMELGDLCRQNAQTIGGKTNVVMVLSFLIRTKALPNQIRLEQDCPNNYWLLQQLDAEDSTHYTTAPADDVGTISYDGIVSSDPYNYASRIFLPRWLKAVLPVAGAAIVGILAALGLNSMRKHGKHKPKL